MWFLMAGWSRLRQKDTSQLRRMCGYILLYWGFLEIKDLVFYAAPTIRYSYISNLLILVDMTAIPAGFCFVGELLKSSWSSAKQMVFHMIPYLLAVVFYAITKSMWIYNGIFIYTVLYGIVYLTYVYFAVKRYNRMLSDNYSNIEFLHVNWLVETTIVLVAVFIVWVISCFFSSWIVDSCYQLLLLVLWAMVIHHADRQKIPSQAIDTTQNLPDHGVLTDALVHKLESLLSEEIWMNPQLTLSDLATEVGTNRTYLSNYLNNTLNTTFYDYINTFRLDAALKILDDPNSTATMVEIAESCGFNSISTFRRVFVRAKGCSLAEYRHEVLESNK